MIMYVFIWKRFIEELVKRIVCATKRTINEKQSDAINEVLIYGDDDSEECKKQKGLNNLVCILYIIAHAGQTIDISVPSLESGSITKSLIDLKRRNNVKVRVVVYNEGDYCNLRSLADNEIDVKVIKPQVKLSHEFIIIDGANKYEAVAILGSLDFEINRVNYTRNMTIISSEYALISVLQREFKRVWESVDATLINTFDDTDEDRE